MEVLEGEIKQAYRKGFLYGIAFCLLIPFALVSCLRTFFEAKVPILNVLAVNAYKGFPIVRGIWWKMPYIGDSDLLSLSSVLFVILVGFAIAGPVRLKIAYSKQMWYWEQCRAAERSAMQDKIRKRIG